MDDFSLEPGCKIRGNYFLIERLKIKINKNEITCLQELSDCLDISFLVGQGGEHPPTPRFTVGPQEDAPRFFFKF